jgi:hypothetical protein
MPTELSRLHMTHKRVKLIFATYGIKMAVTYVEEFRGKRENAMPELTNRYSV